MKGNVDIRAIVAQAKEIGYFDPANYPKLTLSMGQLAELKTLLDKKKIPFGRPKVDSGHRKLMARKDALAVVKALRQGIPAQDGIAHYSVGRDELLSSVYRDLTRVGDGSSRVRFLNADVGQGKTHTLYLLREFAFQHDFVVTIVTLSQHDCPLYDFMTVYNQIMWGLRTADQRQKPAISSIIDRWVEDIRARYDRGSIKQIVYVDLPPNLRSIMGAYVETKNMFRPNELNRQMILKHLSGEKTILSDMRRLGIDFRIDSDNALEMLSDLAFTIRFIGFKGICILFDESEAIHSFSHSSRRSRAYSNLQQIIHQSRRCPHCYFIYATTPSFFASYGASDIAAQAGTDAILELDPLTKEDMLDLGDKIADIYTVAMSCDIPPAKRKAISEVVAKTSGLRAGEFVRRLIAVFDELRQSK